MEQNQQSSSSQKNGTQTPKGQVTCQPSTSDGCPAEHWKSRSDEEWRKVLAPEQLTRSKGCNRQRRELIIRKHILNSGQIHAGKNFKVLLQSAIFMVVYPSAQNISHAS